MVPTLQLGETFGKWADEMNASRVPHKLDYLLDEATETYDLDTEVTTNADDGVLFDYDMAELQRLQVINKTAEMNPAACMWRCIGALPCSEDSYGEAMALAGCHDIVGDKCYG
jgi:hypothetical protein